MSEPLFGSGIWIFQAVVFDMDGVVIDSHPAHRQAWHGFLRTLDRDVCDHELDYILDGRKREDILRHFLGELSAEQLHRYGRQKDAFFRKQLCQVKPMPGLVDFLGELRERQVPLAIATSGSARRTHFTLEQLKLRRYFREIVTANEVEAGKPNPAIYRLACERLSASSSRSLAFEDAFSGVLAAKGAGLRCVGVAPDDDGHRLLAAGADLVLPDFRGLTLNGLAASMNRRHRRSA
jgi:HAD superfamily hydrolase (TIGR01509 family)